MSSGDFVTLGRGELLPALRHDLKRATQRLLVVGPWIDEYFASEIALAAPPALAVKVLMRPQDAVDQPVWQHMTGAVRLLRRHFAATEARVLQRLHAKVVVIDEVAFLGSANFYRFSLENAHELVVRGRLARMEELHERLVELWELATPTARCSPAEWRPRFTTPSSSRS